MKKICSIRYFGWVLLMFGALTLQAQEVPFQRGVNLTGWFQAGSAQEIQFSRYTKQDFEQIKSLGCDVVRLPINLHFMTSGAPDYTVDPLFYNFLDEVIDWAEALDMHLILDNHTFDPAENTDPNIGEVLQKVWSQMATHYQSRSDLIYFEILNEPHGIADAEWNAIQADVIETIREVDTKHTIIVGPANWNSFYNLDEMPVYEDDNLIYTFHFYDPFLFTHQGATWVEPSMEPLRDVPFPYEASRMPELPNELQGTWIESAYDEYAQTGTVASVQELIDIAARFKTERQVPVFCGEFGVYIPNSDDSSRVFWYEQVRQMLEESNIAWTSWDYHGGFGFFKEGGTDLFEHDLNTALLEALGLTVPPQSAYVMQPDSAGFMIYTDYAGPQINTTSPNEGTVNFYSEAEPNNDQYCLFWSEAAQYNSLAFDFAPNKDLSELVEEGYALSFMVRGTDPALTFDVRFMDTKTGEDDRPWRMRMTVDETLVPFDRRWHPVYIPLADFTEQGAWDGEWFNPEGKFDWAAIDRFEIVAEQQAFGDARLWFDNIHITNADTAQVLVTTEYNDIITAIPAADDVAVHVYPNPTQSTLIIRCPSPQPLDGRLMNVSGKVVWAQTVSGTTELSVQHLPAGLYFLHLTDEKGIRSVHKVLVP